MPEAPIDVTVIDIECDLTVERRLSAGSARMERIEANMERIEAKLDENTKATEAAAAAQTESGTKLDLVLSILEMGKAFFKVIGHFGTFVKWAAGIAAPLIAIWYMVHPSKPP